MVFLRLISSSLILLALVRPRLRGRTVTEWRPVLALGFALGAMNWAFYESFARIPLGVAVTIEFVGPLSLAAFGSRRPRDLVWVGLAALGITLFGAGPTKVNAVGFGLALLAGGCWALYIVSTAATGRRWAGVEGLAVASTIATLAIAPFAVVVAGERLLEPRLLMLGALVGLLELGDPLQPRDAGAAHPAAPGVRHFDEPGTGRRCSPPRSCSASGSRPCNCWRWHV